MAPVPETPEEFHRRVASGLRMPPVGDRDGRPFEGELRETWDGVLPPTPRELREDNNLARVVAALEAGA
jgi:hypothetical protein